MSNSTVDIPVSSGAGSVTAADVTYTNPGTAGVPRTVAAWIADRSFSVKDFGAVGNGTTDDTAAINAAISAASTAGGGTVYFPKSTVGYLVSSTITIPDNVALSGMTRDNSVIKAAASFTGTSVLATTAINVSIRDLIVHCNSVGNLNGIFVNSSGALQMDIARVKVIGLAKASPWNNTGIYVKGFNVQIEDIEIDGGVIYGVQLNGASDVFASNILCVNSDIGIALYGCEQVTLENLQLDSCNSNYVVVDTSHDVSFSGVHCFFNASVYTAATSQVGILIGQGSTTYTGSNLNSDIQFSNVTLRNFGLNTASDIGVNLIACENLVMANVSIANTSMNYSAGGTIGVGLKYSQGSNSLTGVISNLNISGVATAKSGTAPSSNWIILSDVGSTNTANTIVKRDSSGNFSAGVITATGLTMTGAINAGSNQINSVAAPTSGTDAVNKNYVDNKVTGLAWRPEVNLLDAVNTVKPSGTTATIDGVSLTNGMRVLFTNLASGSNEIYSVSGVGVALTWTLATDGQAGTGAPTLGDAVLILQGTANSQAAYDYNGSTWVQFNGAGQIQAGTGLSKSGNTLSVSLTGANLPNPSASTLGGVQSAAAVTHQWIDSISTAGVPHLSQPAFSDISGSVSATQLPNPSASTLGGIQSLALVTSKWISAISTAGVPSATQPAFSDISGTATIAQTPLPTAQSKTGAYTVLATDSLIVMDCSTTGSFTATLPSASTGRPIWITRKDASYTAANTGTISRAGSDNIVDNGAAATTTTLNTQNESVFLVPDGSSNWYLVNRNYPRNRIAYTPTIVSFGTVSGVNFVYWRNGPYIFIEGTFTGGTTTGVESQISLPSGLTSVSGLPTLSVCGIMAADGGYAGYSLYTLLEASKTYITIGSQSGTASALAKTLGSTFGSAHVFSICARVPIAGWN